MKKTKLCIICEKEMPKGMKNVCSPWCSRKHNANLKKTKELKVKERKQKIKEKKMNSVKYLLKIADDLWSEAVKINYNYTCQYCWRKDTLNSHHLFTRMRKSTRLDIDNWMCLCSYHHTFSSDFSAHKTGNEFFIWLEWLKGRDWINELSRKSNSVVNFTPEFIKERIEELNKFIKDNKQL